MENVSKPRKGAFRGRETLQKLGYIMLSHVGVLFLNL